MDRRLGLIAGCRMTCIRSFCYALCEALDRSIGELFGIRRCREIKKTIKTKLQATIGLRSFDRVRAKLAKQSLKRTRFHRQLPRLKDAGGREPRQKTYLLFGGREHSKKYA